MRFRVRLSTRQLGAVASSRTSNSSKTTRSDNHLESFFVESSSTEAAETGFRTQPAATARVRLGCRHYVHPVARRHTFLVHAPQHMLRTFHAAQVWQKVSVFWFILRHVFTLPSSFTSSLPDYFVLTTSTYFSTFSVLHVRSTEPVSIHKRTRSLEGVCPTGRLVSTHKNDERSSSTRKLVANTQSSIHAEGFPKCAKEIVKVSNSCDVLSGILQDQCIDVETVMAS